MSLKLPPLVVLLAFAGLMLLLDRFLPVGEFEFFGREALAIFLLGLGLAVMAIALLQFSRAGTASDPLDLEKTSVLVRGGIYKYSRNPMYLGMLLLLLSLGLFLGNAFNTLLAALFVMYLNRFQIAAEEAGLSRTFGKEYSAYLKTTRRWF